jgi:hypothetical protein
MSDLTDLSDEYAEKFDVPEPEMWGFLAGCEVKGLTEEQAHDLALKEYGGKADV